MPNPDRLTPSRRPFKMSMLAWIMAQKRRRPGKKFDDGGVPVEPNRPNTLTGGAAAPLEFDE